MQTSLVHHVSLRELPRKTLAMQALIAKHQIVVVTEFSGSEQELIDFGLRLGAVKTYMQPSYRHPRFPKVFLVGAKRFDGRLHGTRDVGSYWHIDEQYSLDPVAFTVLRPLSIQRGRATQFVSLYDLAEHARSHGFAWLDHCELKSSARFRYRAKEKHIGRSLSQILGEAVESLPDAKHPAFVRHPISGRETLFASVGFTSGVEGVPASLSERFVEFLASSAEALPVTTVPWEDGTAIIWDNRAVMHMPRKDESDEHSFAIRVAVHDGRTLEAYAPLNDELRHDFASWNATSSQLSELMLLHRRESLDCAAPKANKHCRVGNTVLDIEWDEGNDLDNLINSFSNAVADGCENTGRPTYFGTFNCAPRIEGIIGEWFASIYSHQLGTAELGWAACELERLCLMEIAQRLDLPHSRFSHFTSGGMESNLTATLYAKKAREVAAGHDDRQLTVYASEAVHGSVEKCAGIVGLDPEVAVRYIPQRADSSMDPKRLHEQLRRDQESGRSAFLGVLTVGATANGSVDAIQEVEGILTEFNAWCHVDAAWGGLGAFDESFRNKFAKWRACHSVSIDAHKWLGAPIGCGMLFVRDTPPALFSGPRKYTIRDYELEAQPFETTIPWSRGNRGLTVAAILAGVGLSKIEDEVSHRLELGSKMKAELVERGFELLNASPLPLAVATHRLLHGRDDHHRVVRNVRESAGFVIATTECRGEPALRMAICNRTTTIEHVRSLCEELEKAVANRRKT